MGMIRRIFRTNKKADSKSDYLLNNDTLSLINCNDVNEKELIIHNAEQERLQLIHEFNLSLDATWQDIVNKNNELIEKSSIRIK